MSADLESVRFSDLSFPLKIAVVGSWIISVLAIIAFLVGFIGAMLK